jgi:hypothetical protein
LAAAGCEFQEPCPVTIPAQQGWLARLTGLCRAQRYGILLRDQRPDWCGRCSEADGSSARRHLSDDQDTVRGQCVCGSRLRAPGPKPASAAVRGPDSDSPAQGLREHCPATGDVAGTGASGGSRTRPCNRRVQLPGGAATGGAGGRCADQASSQPSMHASWRARRCDDQVLPAARHCGAQLSWGHPLHNSAAC